MRVKYATKILSKMTTNGAEEIMLRISEYTCRICLIHHEEDEMNSLQDEVEFEDLSRLIDILRYVSNCGIPIPEDTEKPLPTRICLSCTDKLWEAYDLIKIIKTAEDLLENAKLEKLESEPVTEEVYFEEIEELIEDDLDASNEVGEQSAVTDDLIECIDFDVEGRDNGVEKDQTSQATSSRRTMQKQEEHQGKAEVRPKSGPNWLPCEHCGRSFAKESTLRSHMRRAHSIIPAGEEDTARPSKLNPIQCEFCHRSFTCKYSFERHMKAAHPGQEVVLPDEEKKEHNYKRGLCPHCGKSFSQSSLVIHIRRHTGEKPYVCKECGTGFPRRQDLIIHERKHTGEKPHVCFVCGKGFNRANKLTRHLRIHTGLRPYKCDKCSRGFAQSNDLKIHLRRHTGEKPYVCNECGERFISGTLLRNHRKLKSHFAGVDEHNADPWAKCRVNNRIQEAFNEVIEEIHEGDEDGEAVEYIIERQ